MIEIAGYIYFLFPLEDESEQVVAAKDDVPGLITTELAGIANVGHTVQNGVVAVHVFDFSNHLGAKAEKIEALVRHLEALGENVVPWAEQLTLRIAVRDEETEIDRVFSIN